jgi:phosphoglycerate dehydrogenase-like enzyme
VKLVIYPPVDEARLARIREVAQDIELVNAADVNQAESAMYDADAFFGKLTPVLLARSSRLRWVQSPTASLEHYVFPELASHPCLLTNMRGIFSDVIADQVFGYILCFARNLHRYIRNQMRGYWQPVGGESERSSFLTGPGVTTDIDRSHMHLADQTLGIVGLGGIGIEVGRRAEAFGMRTLAVDPAQKASTRGVGSVWPPERLADLLRESDFVAICAPHTPQTVKMFRRPQFDLMKRTAYLINVGRGVIVDLADLVASLAEGRIAGAALDVYEVEPLPSDHPLWTFENVILTPHVAGYSPRIAQRHLEVLLDNILRFRSGQPLRNVVNKALWF